MCDQVLQNNASLTELREELQKQKTQHKELAAERVGLQKVRLLA